jgi:hypothetical protein
MKENEERGEIVLYQPEGEFRLEVRMERESVWLSQVQMADLFQKDRTVIGRHIKNIYKEGELSKDITCANFAHMGVDADQTYNTILYNLDVIISVGLRYNLFSAYHPRIQRSRSIAQQAIPRPRTKDHADYS